MIAEENVGEKTFAGQALSTFCLAPKLRVQSVHLAGVRLCEQTCFRTLTQVPTGPDPER